jgi:hypothetical protein
LFGVVMAIFWLYAGWTSYKLDVRGWWVLLIGWLLFTVSGVVTFARHDMTEMYRLMGYPKAMVDQMQRMNFFGGNKMMWMMVAGFIPAAAYLIFIKRYYRRTA